MGVIESIALIPVCSGSHTGWRSETPVAMTSTGRDSAATIGPLPSSGIAEWIYHASDDGVTHRHRQQLAEAFDFVALVDAQEIAQDDHSRPSFLRG